jgi:type II secretory pathway component GspD/PulD (secretin)
MKTNNMKSKMLIATLCVGLVSQRWAMSQTDTNSVATNEPAMSEAAPASGPVGSPAAAETTGVVATNTAMMPAANTGTSPSATSSNETASVTATSPENTNETASATTNMPAVEPVNVLPIQFQDVPITTAIENLARLAGINYLLDPKIVYGQPDQNGQIKPEPTISVRWENVSAHQALLAVLDNYGLQLVVDPKTKIDRITIRNPNAPPPLITRVIQLKYASVSNMEAAVDSSLSDKRSRVIGDSRTSQLVVVATESEQDAVDTLVAQLDKPTRQVLIETRFMEVSSSPTTSKGIDWSGTLSAQNIAFGNDSGYFSPPSVGSTTTTSGGAVVATPPTAGLPNGILTSPGLLGSTATKGLFSSPFFLNADGVKAVLSFLNQDADAQVIATPRVVTLDNERAHIEVTRAQPIFNTTAGTQGSPGGSQVGYTNLGTILDVTPRISANDYIWLTVVPEVSDDAGTVTRIVAGVENQADFYDIRKVTTQVLIPNANTLVMGGFIKNNTVNGYTKVPFLGDIPVLGYAFRSENKSLEKDNLLIFITPTIVKDDDFQPTTTSFLQSGPLEPKSPMNPNSAWSSSKPYDWSNPKNTDPYYNAASAPASYWQTTTNNAPGLQ